MARYYGDPQKRIRRVLYSMSLSRGVAGRSVAAIVALVSPFACVIGTGQVRPQFDIADVHASATGTAASQTMRGGNMRAGLHRMESATMVDLIRTAYSVDAERVVGGPSWLEMDRFDVFAKSAPSTPVDAARPMLQSLLADRFKLALHRDSRLLPGFALRVAKGGALKLKEASGTGSTGCKWTIENGRPGPLSLQTFLISCQNMTMASFAEEMRNLPSARQFLDTGAVTDQTGLRGAWDFHFQYTTRPPASAGTADMDGESITIFDAINKQLGLKLDAQKIPTPVIVVDSVNRTPTENPPDVKTILPPSPPVAFEVASLRLSDPNAPEVRTPGPQRGGRFEVRNFPLSFLIAMGWGISFSELKGVPPWLSSARVDLTAKLPSTDDTRGVEGVADMDAFQPALKALLMERFKIAIHTEERPVPGYALVAIRPRMRKADSSLRTKCKEASGADGKEPRVPSRPLVRQITCQNITMGEFAAQLQLPLLSRGYISGPVLDATGIECAFDFTLSFAARRASQAQAMMGPGAARQTEASDPDGDVSLFEALERQLGLKLERRNIPGSVVVLDHIEMKPTEN